MGDAFEDRKKTHEDKWAHDEALRFKIGARRNKLLGLWAAAEMGITGAAAEEYAKSVVAAEFEGREKPYFARSAAISTRPSSPIPITLSAAK